MKIKQLRAKLGVEFPSPRKALKITCIFSFLEYILKKSMFFLFLTAKNLQNLHNPCWLHYCIRFRWQCDSLHIIFSQTSSVLILCSQPMKHFNPHCHDLSLGGDSHERKSVNLSIAKCLENSVDNSGWNIIFTLFVVLLNTICQKLLPNFTSRAQGKHQSFVKNNV